MDRFDANRRAHERRVSQRRAAAGERPLPCDSEAIWRTSAEILGYSVEAADGALGRVEDFCFEEESAVVTAIVVRARRLMPRTKCLVVPLSAIERIDWLGRKVHLRSARAEVRQWSRAACPPPQHAARA